MKICQKENCNKKLYAKGLCRNHYEMFWRKGHTEYTPNQKKKCKLIDCLIYGTTSGYCSTHYYEFIKKPYQREYVKKWNKAKSKVDLNFRIARNMRSRLYSAIQGGCASSSLMERLGCTLDEFKIYIANKFQSGMSWENYGDWHIDHIKPLSSFDLTNKDELMMASHFSNLQPLWATDNLRKGNKF